MSDLVLPPGATERNHILAVDGDETFVNLYRGRLGQLGLSHTLVSDNVGALIVLGGESYPGSEDYTGIITDELDGGWRDIFERADQLGIRAVLLSHDEKLVSSTVASGKLALYKRRADVFEQAVLAVLV